jgi:hypothetical protein
MRRLARRASSCLSHLPILLPPRLHRSRACLCILCMIACCSTPPPRCRIDCKTPTYSRCRLPASVVRRRRRRSPSLSLWFLIMRARSRASSLPFGKEAALLAPARFPRCSKRSKRAARSDLDLGYSGRSLPCAGLGRLVRTGNEGRPRSSRAPCIGWCCVLV